MSSSSSSSSSMIKHASNCECDVCSMIVPADPKFSNIPSLSLMRNVMRQSNGKGKYNGLKPVRAKLWTNDIGVVSGAGAALALNGNITLTTGNFPELSSWMAVYDLCRIVKGAVHYAPIVQTPGTGTAFGSICAMFDQTAAAPSSVARVLEESFHSPVFILSGGTASNMPNYNRIRSVPFHLPKIAPVGTNVDVGSGWFVLDSTNAPHVVQVQGFIEALVAPGISQFSYFVELDCEFKMRT